VRVTAAVEDDAGRVALELEEAVLTPDPSGERVSDELDATASAHSDTKALWTLTMAIDPMCFFIPVALIAKPIAGKERIGVSNAHQARGADTQPCLTPKTNAQSWSICAQSSSGSSHPLSRAESAIRLHERRAQPHV
jgi:hypothetical protein